MHRFLTESNSTTTISTKERLRKSLPLICISLLVQHLIYQSLDLLAVLHHCSVFPVRLCASFFFTRHLLLDVAEILDGGCGIHPDGRPGHGQLRPGSRQRRHFVILGKQFALGLVFLPDEFLDALADEVDHLAEAHEDADGGGDHHEEGEDLLLAGA